MLKKTISCYRKLENMNEIITNNLITQRLKEKLGEILPNLAEHLEVNIYSRKSKEDKWKLELGIESPCETCQGIRFTEFEDEYCVVSDSRKGEWAYPKQVKWEVSIYNNNDIPFEKFELEKSLLNMILKRMAAGLIDCIMIENIRENTKDANDTLSYIMSGIGNLSIIVSECVEKWMSKKGLPSAGIINQLSAQMYENRPIHDSIFFLTRKDWNKFKEKKKSVISFECVKSEQRILEMNQMRGLRKILELSSDTTSIVITKENVKVEPMSKKDSWSIVGMALNEDLKNEEGIWIEFKGHMKWSLKVCENVIFSYKNGIYQMQLEEYLGLSYEDKIRGICLNNKNTILEIIKLLQEEKHGTSIVFFDKDILGKEVRRLHKKNRCIKLRGEGISLVEYLKLMKGLTAIDGALLADFSGKCSAIGAILDGNAMVKGKVSRGSRYNSIVNYIKVMQKKYHDEKPSILGVIVSEDESVDVVAVNKGAF